MKKYTCLICGYVYDEAQGTPDGAILAGTKWDDLPSDWVCPLCGAEKSEFLEEKPLVDSSKASTKVSIDEQENGEELTYTQLSAIFSNLAKGCEKQYRSKESDLFNSLSSFYDNVAVTPEKAFLSDLKDITNRELETDFSNIVSIAKEGKDRGALRALVWSEKVTRSINSLMKRYEKQGNILLQDKNVYVCEICGFVYVGKDVPDICPVCKVPHIKISQVARRKTNASS